MYMGHPFQAMWHHQGLVMIFTFIVEQQHSIRAATYKDMSQLLLLRVQVCTHIRRSELGFGLPTPRVQAHDNRFS